MKRRAEWYEFFTEECPVCGRTETWKEARYTKKPLDVTERYHYEQRYDWCDGGSGPM